MGRCCLVKDMKYLFLSDFYPAFWKWNIADWLARGHRSIADWLARGQSSLIGSSHQLAQTVAKKNSNRFCDKLCAIYFIRMIDFALCLLFADKHSLCFRQLYMYNKS